MLTLPTAKRYYKQVNFSAPLISRWMGPESTARTALQHEVRLAAAQRATSVAPPGSAARLAARAKVVGLQCSTQCLAAVAWEAQRREVSWARPPQDTAVLAGPNLIFGCGALRVPPDPRFEIERQYDPWWSYGILGGLLEALPCSLAQHAEAAGWPRLAVACTLGAVAGRLLLQLPRLAIGLLTACGLGGMTAGLLAALLVVHGALQAVQLLLWVGGAPPRWAAQLSELGASLWPLVWLHASAVGQLALGDLLSLHASAVGQLALGDLPSLEEGPEMNTYVRRFVDRAIVERRDALQAAGDPASVRKVADETVARLGDYTRLLPTEAAFRGGVAHLRALLERLFDHEDWDPDAYLPTLPPAGCVAGGGLDDDPAALLG